MIANIILFLLVANKPPLFCLISISTAFDKSSEFVDELK
jgi:hypothetical protein